MEHLVFQTQSFIIFIFFKH